MFGKVRKIGDVNGLCPQEKVKDKAVNILNIKNKFDFARHPNKVFVEERSSNITAFLQHQHKEGRSKIAHQLSLVLGNPLTKISDDGIEQQHWCDGICE